MRKRKRTESRVRHDADRRPPAQEATLAREQGIGATARPEIGTVRRRDGQRPTITLEDGSVVDAYVAVNEWERVEQFAETDQEEFRSLVSLAQGRAGDVDPRHVEALAAIGFVNVADYQIAPLTRAVLMNCCTMADGEPVIGSLRLKTPADQLVAEQMRAQLHQEHTEGWARASSPGGWWANRPWKKGKGTSRE